MEGLKPLIVQTARRSQVLDAAMKRYPTTLEEDLEMIRSLPAPQAPKAEPLVKEAPKASAPTAEPLVKPEASTQSKQAQRKRLATMVRASYACCCP